MTQYTDKEREEAGLLVADRVMLSGDWTPMTEGFRNLAIDLCLQRNRLREALMRARGLIAGGIILVTHKSWRDLVDAIDEALKDSE